MNFALSWKEAAQKWWRAARDHEILATQARKRAECYRVLSNSSPAISVSHELDQTRLELATIRTLLDGIRQDLDGVLENGAVSEAVYRQLHHMHTRIAKL